MSYEEEMPEPPIDVESIHRNKIVMGLAALPFLLTLLAIIGPIAGAPELATGAFHGLLFGGIATLVAWRRNPWPSLVPRRVRVTDDALEIGDRTIPRAEIRGGYIVPREGAQVRVQLTRGALAPDIELVVDDEATGLELLQRLGFAPDQAVARFRTLSRTHTSAARIILTLVATMFTAGLLGAATSALVGPAGLGAVLLAAIAAALVLLLAPAFAEVGTDGVLVRWLGRSRFVSHADIESVHVSIEGSHQYARSAVTLRCVDGTRVKIPARVAGHDNGYAAGLARRIEQARDVYRAGRSGRAAILTRGERSFAEWVKALRAGPLGGHRDAQASAEQLWRVVEDPAGVALERAAAAVVLCASSDAAPRLERAAEKTVAPKLRVALDAVRHDADDESLAEALEELEAKPPQKKARA